MLGVENIAKYMYMWATVAIIIAATVKESIHICNTIKHNFLCTCIAIDSLHQRHCVQPNGLATFKI